MHSKFQTVKLEGKRLLGICRFLLEDNIKKVLEKWDVD
jgi:hypothetical protein